jgi:hypothetical protein
MRVLRAPRPSAITTAIAVSTMSIYTFYSACLYIALALPNGSLTHFLLLGMSDRFLLWKTRLGKVVCCKIQSY